MIDYFLEPQNAAKTANMFAYPTTVKADAFIEKGLLANPVIYPPQEVLQKGEYLLDVKEADGEYAQIFNMLKQTKK